MYVKAVGGSASTAGWLVRYHGALGTGLMQPFLGYQLKHYRLKTLMLMLEILPVSLYVEDRLRMDLIMGAVADLQGQRYYHASPRLRRGRSKSKWCLHNRAAQPLPVGGESTWRQGGSKVFLLGAIRGDQRSSSKQPRRPFTART